MLICGNAEGSDVQRKVGGPWSTTISANQLRQDSAKREMRDFAAWFVDVIFHKHMHLCLSNFTESFQCAS